MAGLSFITRFVWLETHALLFETHMYSLKLIRWDMHVFPYIPWNPETSAGLNEAWAGPSLISFLFFSYLEV